MIRMIPSVLLSCMALFAAPAAFAQINLPATIDDSSFGPLLGGETYVASGIVRVPLGETLTVQPGAVVKFQNSSSALEVDGTLLGIGSPAQPIVFTSIHDDTVGVALATRAPAPGDWRRLNCNSDSDASRIEHVEVRFAGARSGFGDPSLMLSGSDMIVRNCLVRDGAGNALVLASSFAPSIQLGSRPSVEDCRFENCAGFAIDGCIWAALPGLRNNTASGNQGGDVVRVGPADGRLGGNEVLESISVGPENGIAGVIFMDFGFHVQGPGTVFTIRAGTILKSGRVNSLVNRDAELRVEGTPGNRVVFTSAPDDDFGGDSFNDGATQGTPGDWQFLRLLIGSRSNLNGALFRYAGTGFRNSTLAISSSEVTLTHSIIERCAGSGVHFEDNRPGAAPVVITDCELRDNQGPALDPMSWKILGNLRDNVAANNAGGNHVEVDDTNVEGGIGVYKKNTLNGTGLLVSDGAFAGSAGDELLFGAGTVLKQVRSSSVFFAQSGGSIVFDGRGGDPVRATTILDDSILGDTNGDGAATQPAPGDWRGVFYNTSARGYCAHLIVRYAGSNATFPGTIHCNSGQVRVTSTRSDFSLSDGFHIRRLLGPGANWIAYRGSSVGVRLVTGDFDVQHATITENAGIGCLGAGAYTGTVFSSIGWLNGIGGGRENFVSVRVFRCNGVRQLNNFFADPMFADPANGDLHISPFSLNVGQGDLPQATLWGVDFEGNSRILDHALNGLALPDIGAYEVFQYRMGIQGEVRLGQSVDFSIGGPGPQQGVQVVFIGPAVGGEFVPPFGVLVTGTLASSLALVALPTGTPFSLPVPQDGLLFGVRVGLQVMVIEDLALPAGNLCNALLTTVTD